MITFLGMASINTSRIILKPLVRNKSISTYLWEVSALIKDNENIKEIFHGENLGKNTHHSFEAISNRVIRVLSDEQICSDDKFKRYANMHIKLRFSTLFQIAKSVLPELTEDDFIEKIYVYTLLSNYNKHLKNSKSANDPGTILDKDFFSRE